MKTDCVSGTSNQIPSTDEIMPDLFHSGMYNTQNSQHTLCARIYIFESCGARMSDNEKSQERDKHKHRSQERNTQAN